MSLPNITSEDLVLLASLRRFDSLRAVSRHLRRKVQNVSTSLKKIEGSLNCDIVHRSTTGITLTPQGQKISDLAQSLMEQFFQLQRQGSDPFAANEDIQLTICSRGFLINAVVGEIVSRSQTAFPSHKFRFIDLSPERTEEAARAEVIDVLISLGDVEPGKNWKKFEVGILKWALYAKVDHHLFQKNESLDLEGYSILGHSYWDNGKLVTPELPKELGGLKLHRFHEIQNTNSALAAMKGSDCLAYLPELAAQEGVDTGIIAKLNVKGVEYREAPLYLHVNLDRISNSFCSLMLAICEEIFS